ncbi:MAG: apolipoprotein N-acyltransferase [Bacteroidales bacterium]|nr:apolipoprotein N-acyltransferase [Bacteroidales bacterium]
MKNITKISLALLSGLLIAASWPTNGFTPLIFIAFVPLIFLQDNSQQSTVNSQQSTVNKRDNIFLLSFLTFLVWNSLTTWWVWNSTPAGSIAMILLNSTFMATTFWLYHITRKKIFHNKKGFFLLILFFLAFENLHLTWQLNWPWLNIGNVFSHNHTWVQWYEFTGIAGGTIWVLLANILAYKVIKRLKDYKTTNSVTEPNPHTLNSSNLQFLKSSVPQILLFLAVVLIPIIASKIMYHSYEEKGEEVEVVVAQPNIDPWNEEFRLSAAEILNRNFSVAEPLITENTRFVLSPESSIHENIWLEKINYYRSIKESKLFSKNNDVTYVVGASTLGMAYDKNDFAARKFYDVDEYYYSYNTALSINDTTDIQIHQKSKLTPGVEMMPSWWFLRPIKNLAIDLGGTVGTLKSEDTVSVFDYGKYKAAPLICYESVFGGYVTDFVRNGANIIFVITNDGWWGDTPGHRQHFEMSKLRAIENRRSVARSANTGVSGFINQRGDVVESSNYWEPIGLRNTLNVNDEMTFYSRHGDYIYRAASFIAALVLCFTIVISIKKI